MYYLQSTNNSYVYFNSDDDLLVIGYIDLDLAGCVDDLKSTSRYTFTLIGGTIS